MTLILDTGKIWKCFLSEFYFLHCHDSVSLANLVLLALLYIAIKTLIWRLHVFLQLQVYTSYRCFKWREGKKVFCTGDFWLQRSATGAAAQVQTWCRWIWMQVVTINKFALLYHLDVQPSIHTGEKSLFSCSCYGFEIIKLLLTKTF